MYDVTIIGGAPAGLTAAIYCGRQQLKTLLLVKELGGQTAKSHLIENYPGFTAVNGVELSQKMFEQAKNQSAVEIKIGLSVDQVEKVGDNFKVQLSDGSAVETKTVIIAAGKNSRYLNIPGEKEFYGKGVTYCSTCDGPLFKNKTVAVVGGGNSGLDAALQLAVYCPQVYLLEIGQNLRGEKIRQEKLKTLPNVKVLTGTKIVEVKGEKIVQAIAIENENGVKDLAVNGVFVEIGYIPATEFIKDLLELNQWGEIKINNKNETSVAGIFAAGDITDVPYKQTVVAAGEGAKAALSAIEYVLGEQGGSW